MGEAGMAGSFLQTTAASSLRRFAMEKADLPDETRQELLSFLSGKDSEEYAPQSGQIVGILKEMDDEMTKSLGEATATEEAAIKTHEALIAAKTKEVEALTAQIEEEQTRIGDLGVEIAGMENDLEDTQQSLAEDKKFVAELAGTCEKKKKEWAEIEKVRAQDLIALALRGKKIGFEKVISMIDDMVANLKKEQLDDESKKEYCDKQLDATEDKKKG